MPIRTYRCEAGHTHDALVKGHPPTHACETCGAEALSVVTGTAPPVISGHQGPREGSRTSGAQGDGFTVTLDTPTLRVREKGVGLVHFDYICAANHEHGVDVESKPETPPVCPGCGAPSQEQIKGMPAIDWWTASGFSSTGGYYDAGLGRWITSPQHRREVMAELGVVEMDWRSAMDAQARADSVKATKEDAVVAEMLQGFEHGPDAAALKTARDRGEVPDWSEHAATLGVT